MMNFTSLIDTDDLEGINEVKNVMRSFKYLDQSDTVVNKEVFDVQSIMKEGRIEDLAKCIQSILNYNFNAYTSDNNVKIIDPSFVQFFRVAQFIIRFLLYWKTELLKRYMKQKTQSQELDKLRRECSTRKLENRELRKQVLKNQNTNSAAFNNSSISECSRCQKVFLNSSFLIAHHKKRHPDQPFNHPKEVNEIQVLKNEVGTLKYELKKLSASGESSSNDVQEPNITKASLKMRLSHESGSLQAQEIFWRSRLKEAQRLSDDLAAENSMLKEQLAIFNIKPSTSSVSIQTEFSYLTLRHSINDFLSTEDRPLNSSSWKIKRDLPTCSRIPHQISTSPSFLNSKYSFLNSKNSDSMPLKSTFPENISLKTTYDSIFHLPSERLYSPLIHNQNSNIVKETEFPQTSNLTKCDSNSLKSDCKTIPKQADVLTEVDTFLRKYDKLKIENCNQIKEESGAKNMIKRNIDVKQVITKLFPTDTNSELFANKLIEIYEKRRSLVVDGEDIEDTSIKPLNDESATVNGTNEIASPTLNSLESMKDKSTTEFKKLVDKMENDDKSNKELADGIPVKSRVKLKFLPFFRNIPNKILKNYSKSRKTRSRVSDNTQNCNLPGVFANSEDPEISTVAESSTIMGSCIANEHILQNKNQCLPTSKTGTSNLKSKETNVERKLSSAMKKSKSTGNITKKVAFTDELPTFKTVSELDLRKISDSSLKSSSQLETHLIGTVDVLRDRFNKPVPAPRSKKNIILSKNSHYNQECDGPIPDIEQNM